MSTFVTAAAFASTIVRLVLMVLVAVIALVCVLDWAVRTRRISPFNPIARFLRASVDPLLRPIEQRIVRAGGLPSAAPLWALAIAVVGGIILMSVLDFIIGQLATVYVALTGGPAGLYHLLVMWTFAILRIALLIRVVISWLPISPYSPWVRWTFSITEPILRPLRQIVPTLGMFDITPVIAYFILGFIEPFFLRLM